MPIRHDVHIDVRLIHVTYSGNLTTREVLKFFDRYERCLQRHPGFAELVDLSTVSKASIPKGQVQCLMSLLCGIYSRNLPTRVGALVTQGGLGRSLAEDFIETAASQSVFAWHHCGNTSEAFTKFRSGTDNSFFGYHH